MELVRTSYEVDEDALRAIQDEGLRMVSIGSTTTAEISSPGGSWPAAPGDARVADSGTVGFRSPATQRSGTDARLGFEYDSS